MGEASSAPSPDPLPVMAEIHPVHIGQCACRTGRKQPLMGLFLSRRVVLGAAIGVVGGWSTRDV